MLELFKFLKKYKYGNYILIYFLIPTLIPLFLYSLIDLT